jgi:D-alanyl-D-alanine carboxypeptidase/Zn-dependent metalloprotease
MRIKPLVLSLVIIFSIVSMGFVDTVRLDRPIVDSEDNQIETPIEGPPTDWTEESPDSGMLEIFLTDAPIDDVEQVIVQFESIEVNREGHGWVAGEEILEISDWVIFCLQCKQLDLMPLQNGTFESLGVATLPAGKYSQIRLKMASAKVVVDGKTENVTIPSGHTSGLKLTLDFEVEPGKMTVLKLDFDARESLHYSPGRGWILRPVIKVIAAMVEPVFRIEPTQLVALGVLERASATPHTVRFGDYSGVPEFLSGYWTTDPTAPNPEDKAIGFIETYGDLFRLDPNTDSFKMLSVDTGRLGLTNVRLQQMYQGVPVFGAELVVHLDSRNNVLFMNGVFVPGIGIGTAPRITALEAQVAAVSDLQSKFGGVRIGRIDPAILSVWHTSVFNRFGEGTSVLVWFVVVRTEDPDGLWFYMVNASDGGIVESWDNAPRTHHPSEIYDAMNTASTADDVLWFKDGVQQQAGAPPDEVSLLNNYSCNFYDYLKRMFGINSIDDGGMRLVSRANYASASMSTACWDCREDEAVFASGFVTQDIVAHELTHGLIEKLGGNIRYLRQSGAINEAIAEAFGEFLDCETECNWLIGVDAFLRTLRDTGSMGDPTRQGDRDHVEDYLHFGDRCDSSNDNCGVHSNSGMITKAMYLLAQGGTHNGISVEGLGAAKAGQILFSTLADTGVTSSVTFLEFRDVMQRTCRAMVGIIAGIASSDCASTSQIWLAIGLSHITQDIVGATNEKWDKFGWSLATGDFNGDDRDDLAVGVPYKDNLGTNDGIVYVFYGGAFGLKTHGAEQISQTTAGINSVSGDTFGWSLAAGDFDGDGHDDLAVGAPHKNLNLKSDTGMVIIFYGSGNGLLPTAPVDCLPLDQNIAGGTNEEGDRFGWSLAAGNFSDDDYDDLAVGIPFKDNVTTDDGMVIVFYGSSVGLLTGGTQHITQHLMVVASGEKDHFGWALASGNFNGDDYDDLAIGVPEKDWLGETDNGQVVVFYGGSLGLVLASYELLDQNITNPINEEGDRFGWSLTAGNFNGDDWDDLAIGIPFEDYDYADDGIVVILYGSGAGLMPAVDPEWVTQREADSINYYGDLFGWSLASGDFDGDAFDDLVVGVPCDDWKATNTGTVDVFYGSADGLLPLRSYMLPQSYFGGHGNSGDRFGFALASGDFDGDGMDSLAVSSPFKDIFFGITDTGKVYVRELEPAVPEIAGESAIVAVRDVQIVLGIKNPDERRWMASTTKIMTALITIERTELPDTNFFYLDLNQTVTATANASSMVNPNSSHMGLATGDQISLYDLLFGLLLPSGNDAAVAIGELISGEGEGKTGGAFSDLMSLRASQLGLANTNFRNPWGGDSTDHYTTARDLQKLTRIALGHELFVTVVGSPGYYTTTWVDQNNTGKNKTFCNTNLLIRNGTGGCGASGHQFAQAYGVKTGTSPGAGRCLVSAAADAPKDIIAVLLGSVSPNDRYNDSKKLLNYGFDVYHT